MSVTAISGIATAALTGLKFYRNVTKNEGAEELIDGIADIRANSIIELSKASNMEYITVIDRELTVQDYVTDVLKYVNSSIAAWTLAAADVSTCVGSVKTVKLLERINPSKSPSYAIANTLTAISMEGFESIAIENGESFVPTVTSLPTTNASLESLYSIGYSAEAKDDDTDKDDGKSKDKQKKEYLTNKKDYDPNGPLDNVSGKVTTDLSTVQNLSIGQMITLNVTDGVANKDVTINVRLITIPVERKLLTTILSWSQKDLRLKSRVRAWRTGELKFWRDVVLLRDVFTERKRILMNDNSDLLMSMLGRQRDSMLHSVLTATPSIGTMSSVLVMSSDTLKGIERTELNGRLKDFKFRQQIMNTTGLMMIVVVDPLSELVTVYTHTKSLASEFSLKQMKSASKGSSTDFAEILKLINQNNASSF